MTRVETLKDKARRIYEAFRRSDRCGVMMSEEDRKMLWEAQQEGLVRFASHTQIEWTEKGAQFITQNLI